MSSGRVNGRVIVGVTGGIASYKVAALVSQLVQSQVGVSVVMTSAAQQFIGSATFAALTGRPVATQVFDDRFPLGAHIELAQSHDLLCIAPATADFLAKMAHGAADDLLSTLYLCFAGPVLVAPAMNDQMWRHPAVQRNMAQLVADGVGVVSPVAGWLSCRQSGVGRMAEPDAIRHQVEERLKAIVRPE